MSSALVLEPWYGPCQTLNPILAAAEHPPAVKDMSEFVSAVHKLWAIGTSDIRLLKCSQPEKRICASVSVRPEHQAEARTPAHP